jgi:acetyl esterase/lipase
MIPIRMASLLALLALGAGAVTRLAQAADEKQAYALRENLVYTPQDWPQPLHADAYVPRGDGPFPAVVVVHGGGWNGRDRSDMDGISEALARNGFVVLNIQYRLAPAFHHPAPVQDVRAAVSYLRREAAALKVDPARIGGWGYSAGAHLVTLAANAPDRGVALLQAVVAGGMPADFRRYPDSPVITEYIGAPFAKASEAWHAASPFLQVSADDPPMFLYHGKLDRIVQPEELPAMRQALEDQGVPVESHEVPMLGHIATFLFSGESRERAIDFLQRRLQPSTTATRAAARASAP